MHPSSSTTRAPGADACLGAPSSCAATLTQATFSLDSGAEFSVFPTEGVLPPQGSPPTQFVVSFTPHEYGKACVAKLFVEVSFCYVGAWLPGVRLVLEKLRGRVAWAACGRLGQQVVMGVCCAVQTEEMMWFFEVRGQPPEYSAPVGVTRVDTKMDPDTMARMANAADQSRSRNIMRENIAGAKQRAPGVKASSSAASVASRK